jgi:hypothetical protein
MRGNQNFVQACNILQINDSNSNELACPISLLFVNEFHEVQIARSEPHSLLHLNFPPQIKLLGSGNFDGKEMTFL